MRWRKLGTIGLTLATALGVMGCGKSTATIVTLTITPTIASVITNRTQQFSSLVTGNSNTTVTWTIACATGVTAPACGTIDSTGLYTAPKVIPTVTSNGTTTISPTATITATAAADTTKTQTATVTIVTGIGISISPTTATVGTGETFNNFTASVNNPGCNTTTDPTCLNVTWSLPTVTTAGSDGTIDANTGSYKAPAQAPNPNTITVTATSVADTSVTATAEITIVTSTPPTVTAVNPNVMALGGVFQDAYITGTNFISTNNVYVNGVPLSSSLVTDVSSSLIRIRIPDYILAAPPAPPLLPVLQISVSQQSGAQASCATAALCNITVQNVQPGLIGPSPDSISQGSGVISFNVDGGFFGTAEFPAVSAYYNGSLRAVQMTGSGTPNSTRQLQVTLGGSSNANDFDVPGLYPVKIQNATDPSKFAVTNVAIQPNYNGGSTISTIVDQLVVGTSPSDVAINPATGMAVVANRDSNSVSLIDLTLNPPSVVATICTAAVGAVAPCPSAGPTSVSVDYVRNIAVVANTAAKTIAVVDLHGLQVSFVTPPLTDSPGAIGINPVTGRALIAMQTRNYGLLMNLIDDPTQPPPNNTKGIVGTVTISSGNNTRVAVEPHLNWAVATPGGLGSIGIVDLNRQTQNVITNITRNSAVTSNTVTVTVDSTAAQPPLTVQVGDVVDMQGVTVKGQADTSLDGFFTVSTLGPGFSQFQFVQSQSATLPDIGLSPANGTINYARPVATVGLQNTIQGIGINTETQQAVLVDPSANGVVSFFSLIDQSVSTLALRTSSNSAEVGTVAAAFNPLTNTAVTVNPFFNTLSVIDPIKPFRLNEIALPHPGAAAVAVDPGTNYAVVANQTDNSVTIFSLGPIQPLSITESSPKTYVVNSILGSTPSASPQTLTVLGKGFSSGSRVFLDNFPLSTTPAGSCNNPPTPCDRQLTATVPASLLSSAHRYALEVQDASGAITNAEDFTVEQSVDVSACSPTPYPAGVAIDPLGGTSGAGEVAITLEGCGSVALIDMGNYSGSTKLVGSNPIGIAALPRQGTRPGLFVVANAGSTNAVVMDNGGNVTHTITTGAGPTGVATDPDTGQAAVANSVANTVTVLDANNGGASTLSVGQNPVDVAINYQNHEVAAAAAGSDSIGFGTSGAGSLNTSIAVTAPSSVVYDPLPADCGPSNTLGCFIAASSTTNQVDIIDPLTSAQTAFRVGINPTAIAYNYLTSTLVSTNTLSHTVTVADLLGKRIRAVLTLPPAPQSSNLITGLPQFALDIHPFTNLAVIADTMNGRILFVPLPH